MSLPTTQPYQAMHSPLFPTLGTLQEVYDLAESKLPIIQKNDIVVLLRIYHNTLLSIQAQK